MEDSARKKLAHVIAIGIEPEKAPKADEVEEDGPDEALVAAAEEAGRALKKEDWHAFADALESFVTICSHKDYPPETEDDDNKE